MLADALGLPDQQAREQLLHTARPMADAQGPDPPASPPGGWRPTPQPVVVPRQLPAPATDFVGRETELKALSDLLDSKAATGAVVISAIGGTAGVGKTALALHWAHRVAGRFPDGQLHSDLRGFGPAGAAEPAAVIRSFLDAFGVPPERIPKTLENSAALYRSVLAGRRALVVLDNARNEEQVRPLLPGSPGCVAVVTSRRRLSGLIAVEGARSVTVDLLSPAEARELLARRLGSARISAEPEAVSELIEQCARLPLALVVAAARAVCRPGPTLAAIAAELRSARSRLDVLDADDTKADVRAVLSWSYHSLSPPAARMFRLLGVHPGPDITAGAAASLAATGLDEARQTLGELACAYLLAEHSPGRYALHDLLRAYAAEQAASEDPAQQRTALHRALDHYLHTAHGAAALLTRARRSIVLASPQPGVTPERPSSHEEAVAWFDRDREALLAAAARAAEAGFHAHAWQIPCVAEPFFFLRGLWPGLTDVLRRAVDEAQRAGDLVGEARALKCLGRTFLRLERHADAMEHLRRALGLLSKAGDPMAEALCHIDIGGLLEHQGLYHDAIRHAMQARDLFHAAGNLAGEAGALNNIGWYHALLGDYERTLRHCEQALAAFRQVGDRSGEAAALDSLGFALHRLGDHERGIAHCQEALRAYREFGNRYSEAELLTHIGDAWRAAGDHQAARDAWQQALAILDDLQHPDAAQVRDKVQSLGTARRLST
jgi:tetratricopeptide (TPR) repeat protein